MTAAAPSQTQRRRKTPERATERKRKTQERPTERKRKAQGRAELTREKLITAAKSLFSQRGYDAVAVREIEVEAGVQRNLLYYHFGSKEGLWKVVAADMLAALEVFRQNRDEVLKDLPPHEHLAYSIRSYVRFCASMTEFHRMMLLECKRNSWRLEWLVETLLRPAAMEVRELVAKDPNLHIDDEEFVSWYYMFIGAGATIFSLAPEAELLFGFDPTTNDAIDRHAQLMVDFLLSKASK